MADVIEERPVRAARVRLARRRATASGVVEAGPGRDEAVVEGASSAQ
jgi:hypothetical protein